MYILMISLTLWGRFTAIYCTGNLNLLGDPSFPDSSSNWMEFLQEI
jgi:hypothetical protein